MVHVWTLDPPAPQPLTLRGHTGEVNGVTFTTDGSAVLAVGSDGTLRRWDAESGRPEGGFRSDAGELRAVATGGENGLVALAGDRLRLRQAGGNMLKLEGHTGAVLCVAFSPNGAVLASGGTDNSVRLWRTSDGRELVCFEGHTGPVRTVAVSPDHRFVYSGSADGTLRRWVIGSAAPPGSPPNMGGSSMTGRPKTPG
jgi:WD40 repeat protein